MKTTNDTTAVFLRLVRECEGILQKICRLYFDNATDREDIRQDILLNAWKSYHSFKGESKFSTWFYQVAINTSFSKLKKKIRLAQTGEITNAVLSIAEENQYEGQLQVENLYMALRELNDIDKTVALLYLDQLSYREIASITGIPEASVGVRISRIKEKLRKKIEKYGHR